MERTTQESASAAQAGPGPAAPGGADDRLLAAGYGPQGYGGDGGGGGGGPGTYMKSLATFLYSHQRAGSAELVPCTYLHVRREIALRLGDRTRWYMVDVEVVAPTW